MIKGLIAIVLIAIVIGVGNFIYSEYTGKNHPEAKRRQQEDAAAAALDGIPPELHESLGAARAGGPGALKQWLEKHGRRCGDPGLASVQLDYVMQMGRTNPSEAKKLFQQIRGRIRPDSPVYEKMRKIEPTFGR